MKLTYVQYHRREYNKAEPRVEVQDEKHYGNYNINQCGCY